MKNLQNELNSDSPCSGIKKGQLAATKFQNLWHRVRVEGIKNDKADVYYIDFGNVFFLNYILYHLSRKIYKN